MPITSSAKKALRASKKKRVYNLARMRAVKDAERKIKNLLIAGKVAEAKALVSEYQKALDKAAKGKTIKANKASRKKSRIATLVNKAK